MLACLAHHEWTLASRIRDSDAASRVGGMREDSEHQQRYNRCRSFASMLHGCKVQRDAKKRVDESHDRYPCVEETQALHAQSLICAHEPHKVIG